jgi:hypothetical protein
MQYVILTTYNETGGQPRLSICYSGGLKRELIPCIDRNLTKRFLTEDYERHVETWKILDPMATVLYERTIEGALDRARKIGHQNNGMQALVTESLHLVSGALYLLKL